MPLVQEIDNYDLTEFLEIARNFGQERFGYVVTPNADHVILYYDEPYFRSIYAAATFVLLDSRFLSYVLRVMHGTKLHVCPGSDLTEQLFEHVIQSDDVIVMIGGTEQQAKQLADTYSLSRIKHYIPPMGFIRDPDAVEACLRFVESQSPFRFCVLAVGTPQQEMIAQRLEIRGKSRGLALCVGAAINLLTGYERRAPRWIRVIGFEWAFRLWQNPSRLARRYLIRGPRVFGLLRKIRIVARRPVGVGA